MIQEHNEDKYQPRMLHPRCLEWIPNDKSGNTLPPDRVEPKWSTPTALRR